MKTEADGGERRFPQDAQGCADSEATVSSTQLGCRPGDTEAQHERRPPAEAFPLLCPWSCVLAAVMFSSEAMASAQNCRNKMAPKTASSSSGKYPLGNICVFVLGRI